MSDKNERVLNSNQFQRHKASEDTKRKIVGWHTWECKSAEFKYDCDRTISLFIYQGTALLTFAHGEKVDLQAGDFLTIESGTHSLWVISEPLLNSYMYHDTFISASRRTEQIHWKKSVQNPRCP